IELANIAAGEPSGQAHAVGTLQSQRGVVLDFLKQEQYPTDARNDLTRKEWIKPRWEWLIQLLSCIPCPCSYSQEFEGFLATAKQYPPLWKSQAQLADLVLAYLHNTTPSNVGRLLKGDSSTPSNIERLLKDLERLLKDLNASYQAHS